MVAEAIERLERLEGLDAAIDAVAAMDVDALTDVEVASWWSGCSGPGIAWPAPPLCP